MKEGEKEYCDKGHKGDCCCNCIHQLVLKCHPFNKNFGKGSMSETCGYVCKVECENNNNKGSGIYSDNKHGMCEFHMSRKGLKEFKLSQQKEKYK